jgi:hypothetical protein
LGDLEQSLSKPSGRQEMSAVGDVLPDEVCPPQDSRPFDRRHGEIGRMMSLDRRGDFSDEVDKICRRLGWSEKSIDLQAWRLVSGVVPHFERMAQIVQEPAVGDARPSQDKKPLDKVSQMFHKAVCSNSGSGVGF